jgi:hypothetical protein
VEYIAVGIGIVIFGMGVWYGYTRSINNSVSIMTYYILIELEKSDTLRLTRKDGAITMIEPGTKPYTPS